MRRILDSSWFVWATGMTIGGLAAWGLTSDASPAWVRWVCKALFILLFFVLLFLPFFLAVHSHFVALRRGLMHKGRLPHVIKVVDQSVLVEHGKRRTRFELDRVSRVRRARNDNWTVPELEDALGLFSANGKELVRVPLSATGLDVILRELESRGVPVDDVAVSPPG